MTSQTHLARRERARERALSINKASIIRFVQSVSHWYTIHGRDFTWRRSDYPFYKLIVTELLLQRTRAETVEKNHRLFFADYTGWSDIADADISWLCESLRPFGLWRRRAKCLHELALAMVELGGKLPEDRSEISKLPGLGHYMVSAILLYRDGSPEPLLDGSMARLLERYFGMRELADIRFDPYLKILSRRVVQSASSPHQINWAMLDLAAKVCVTRKPRCDECPLQASCSYANTEAN